MSLLTALISNFKLGGVVCLSGWLPLQHKIKLVRHPTLSFLDVHPALFYFHADDKFRCTVHSNILGSRNGGPARATGF